MAQKWSILKRGTGRSWDYEASRWPRNGRFWREERAVRLLLFLRLDQSLIYSGQATAQTIAGHLVDFWLFFLVFSLIPLKDNAQTLFFVTCEDPNFWSFRMVSECLRRDRGIFEFCFFGGTLGLPFERTKSAKNFCSGFFFPDFCRVSLRLAFQLFRRYAPYHISTCQLIGVGSTPKCAFKTSRT